MLEYSESIHCENPFFSERNFLCLNITICGEDSFPVVVWENNWFKWFAKPLGFLLAAASNPCRNFSKVTPPALAESRKSWKPPKMD